MADPPTGGLLSNMFFVYTIQNSATQKIYIGHTINLNERLKRHNGLLKSKAKSFTIKQKYGGRWNLVYQKTYASRKEAMARERQLKSFRGREFIKNRIMASDK